MCDVGASGRQRDRGFCRNSAFGIPSDVSPEFQNVPYVFVADDAFALTINMLKNYEIAFINSNLTVTQRIFNSRLSLARRIIENAFGILCIKWRIFRTPIITKLDTVESIIMACSCLHNWLSKNAVLTFIRAW